MTFRRALLILILVILAAAAVAVLYFRDRVDGPLWALALASIIVIGGMILAFLPNLRNSVELVRSLLSPGPTQSEDFDNPLIQLTFDQLHKRYLPGKSGSINWIDRHCTHNDDLAGRRVIITGRIKLGKTREAIELIRRAIAQERFAGDRLFIPSNSFRILADSTIKAAIQRHVQTDIPLLLFVDNLPYHFPDEEALQRLAAAQSTLSETAPACYFVATARSDQLTDAHTAWFKKQNASTLALTDLTPEQTTRLVDNAAGLFNQQMEDEVRQRLIATADGTPELTLITFRRAAADGITRLSPQKAPGYIADSLAHAWQEARADIIERQPAALPLLQALTVFRAAKVDPYNELVLAFAADLWPRLPHNTASRWPQHRRQALHAALAYLHHFNFSDDGRFINSPDYAVEATYQQVDAAEAGAQIAAFLSGHKNRRKLPWFSAAVSPQTLAFAYFDLAYATPDTNQAKQVQFYTQCIQLNPDRDTTASAYNNRGLTYNEQGDWEAALADYGRAIQLNPEYAAAYNNRGITYKAQGDWEAALADYGRAIQLDPEDANAYGNRGETYAGQGKWEAALADFSRAIELDSDNDWWFYSRALIYQLTDQPYEADQDLATAIRLAQAIYDKNPQDWRNCFNLALYQLVGGEAEAGQRLYEQAIGDGAPPTHIVREAIKDLDDYLKQFGENEQAQAVRDMLARHMESN